MLGPIPPYPVPVVRLILVDNHKRVLLLQRADGTYGSGSWCLPGGKIDYGQTVEEVVQKELKEETNLNLMNCRFLFFQDSLPMKPGAMHCLNLYFECRASGEIALNQESTEFRWIGPEEIGQFDIAFRNDAGLRSYWQSL